MSLYNKIIDLQKLGMAWKDVYSNKPAQGVDNITYQEFENHKSEYLKELFQELQEHRYQCMPVKVVPLYKGEKVRYISLYSMRDKALQNSIAKELSVIYEKQFLPCCCAYRSGSSAMQVAKRLEPVVKNGKWAYVLKADIKEFFDCIPHDSLIRILRKTISESDVLELIRNILTTSSVESDGELKEKTCGIYQGASISPILSNIYLMDLDQEMQRTCDYYVRYADDILILCHTVDEAKDYLRKLMTLLECHGLRLNEKKTKAVSLDEGFEYLGYHFDKNGMSIPGKAQEHLNERLEDVWLGMTNQTVEEKLKKCQEIIGGWEQYYQGKRELRSILEYLSIVRGMESGGEYDWERLKKLRTNLSNDYLDVVQYLTRLWIQLGKQEYALYEYEQYYHLETLDSSSSIQWDSPLIGQLLDFYSQYIIHEAEDTAKEIAQLYTDLKQYQKAEGILNRSQQLKKERQNLSDPKSKPSYNNADTVSDFTNTLSSNTISRDLILRYMELFAGREDVYSLDESLGADNRTCKEVIEPLLPDVVKLHLQGKKTIGTYVQRNNGTVHYLVVDLDISRGILLKCSDCEKQAYMEECLKYARLILKELEHMGLSGQLEMSGYRGYHVWIFFEEWLPIRYANHLSDMLEQRLSTNWRDSGIQVEYFPNKSRIKPGKMGQSIKLPWGIHPKSGNRSCLVDEDGNVLPMQINTLNDIFVCNLSDIKRAIISSQQQISEDKNNTNSLTNSQLRTIEVSRDLSIYGELDRSVAVVLEKCNIIRYLCHKSYSTNYLTHYERLTLLYVLGHLGEPGKEFLHQVISYTLNYSFNVTDKFIHRCPEKPISCLKLREQYKQISSEIGCSCNFKRTKDCYPSPVLHSLKHGGEESQITMPLSRTITTEKQQVLKREINIESKVQEIAERMLDLRKQRRGLDKNLKKCEKELADIYDDCKTDSMEIKMGLLVRRKTDHGSEWLIEL